MSHPIALYLVRHAHAGKSDPSDPNDHLRPLSAEGHAQARAMALAFGALDLTLHRLFSSPYTRAAESAQPLARHAAHRKVEPLEGLTQSDYPALLHALKTVLRKRDTCIALVGHEPYLSELAAYLLTGDPAGMSLEMRKGMLVQLEGPLEPGSSSLRAAFPPKLLKRLAAT